VCFWGGGGGGGGGGVAREQLKIIKERKTFSSCL